MHDYRLLMPALVFWAVRVGWISPLQTVLLISIAVLILAYLAYTGIGRECLAQTVAGMVFAAVIAIAVGLILPLPEKSSRYGANNLLPKECNASIFQGESIYAHAENFRCIIHTQFRMLGADFSDQTAGILRGVVLGDATGLPADLRNQVKLAGLQHLVAISGAHISLLIGVAMILLGRRRRRLTAMIASIFLFLLVGLVGLSASVLRAAIMGIVALIAFSLGRGSGVIAALSLGVIVGAAFWPDLAAGIGFQMSVITTGAIIVIGNSFLQIPAIVNRRWATWLVIPLIAGTAIIPISAQLQPQLSLFAVPANIVVAPVIPVITVLGLAAAVIGAFIPAIAAILLFPCAIGAWWVSQVARFSTMFTAFIFPVWVVAVIQLGGLILLLLWARKQSVRDSAKIEFARQGWPRFWSWPYFIIAGVVICILLIFPLMPVIIGNKTSFAWEFIQCDVGQGSGLLARNGGKTVLIDTGKERSNAVPCLRRHKIRKLDLLIISHLDADHVGGFEQVLAEVQVEQVWLSENQHPQYRHKQVLAAAQKEEIPIKHVKAHEKYADWIEILSPLHIYGGEDDTNTDSLVLDLRLQTHRVLVLSDVPAEIQENLVPMKLPQFSCVIVAHHGAKSQSARLAAKIKPEISLISVGRNNYGHPHRNAFAVWQAPLIKTTLDCGDIMVGAKQYQTQKRC